MNAFEPLNFPRLPRSDELQKRPELASVVSLITLLEIVRRVWRASPHRNHLWKNNPTKLNDSERRIRGLELRAFYLLVELEEFLTDSYNLEFRHFPSHFNTCNPTSHIGSELETIAPRRGGDKKSA